MVLLFPYVVIVLLFGLQRGDYSNVIAGIAIGISIASKKLSGNLNRDMV
jgi:hypothetical protein